jgi:phosphoserine phosphatase RsbU/P
MRILVAEDDAASLRRLEATLARWGFDVSTARDGLEALGILAADDGPALAVLDWMMPGMDGVDVCREVSRLSTHTPPYVILLTARRRPEDVVAGLEAGAADYITKPYDSAELRARIQVGARVVSLQREVAQRVAQLEQALSQVKQLRTLLPICCYCKKIRDDHDYWEEVESYIGRHSDTQFSHGVCPSCYQSVLKPQLERFKLGEDDA